LCLPNYQGINPILTIDDEVVFNADTLRGGFRQPNITYSTNFVSYAEDSFINGTVYVLTKNLPINLTAHYSAHCGYSPCGNFNDFPVYIDAPGQSSFQEALDFQVTQKSPKIFTIKYKLFNLFTVNSVKLVIK
jgi:hypothetical protein